MLRNDKGDSWKDTTQEANRVLKPFKGTWRPQHPVKRFLHINAKSAPTHDTDFEFISTHIQGKWHLAAVQSKCDWETRIKVTPACVITLGNVFVCSIYLPKGSGFNICEKSQTTWQYWICVSCCRGREDKHIKVCAVKVHPCVNKQHVYTVWYCPERGKHFHTTHLQNKRHIYPSGNVRKYANNVGTKKTNNKLHIHEKRKEQFNIWRLCGKGYCLNINKTMIHIAMSFKRQIVEDLQPLAKKKIWNHQSWDVHSVVKFCRKKKQITDMSQN